MTERTVDDMISEIQRRWPGTTFAMTRNDGWVAYESVSEEIRRRFDAKTADAGDLPNEMARRAIKAGTLWNVQLYPDTPVGFIDAYGVTLHEALTRLIAAALAVQRGPANEGRSV